MSQSNGVIRIGRKGLKKFALGEEGQSGSKEFIVDIVLTFDQWLVIDDGFRPIEVDNEGNRPIPRTEMPAYHQAAANFVELLRPGSAEEKNSQSYEPINAAEALDFLARLREEYEKLANFFRPKLQEEPVSQDTSEVELRFSEEPRE